jgi:hypothetical protein
MGIEMLARLLEETAAEVPAPALAEAAWAGAQQVAVGTALAVGAAPSAAPPPIGSTPPTVTVTASAPVIDKLPGEPANRHGAPLPRTLATVGAQRITDSPLSRAVALYQQEPGQTQKLTPVYVLGSDGAVRWLDEPVKLDFTRDAGGKLTIALTPTSLSPDGRRVALPQPDRLVVVDLTTGKADSFSLPGWNGDVVWRGNGSVLVGQAHAAYVVDLTSRIPKPLPATFPVRDMAVDADTTHPVVDLPSGGERLTLCERVMSAAEPRGEVRIDQSRLGGYRIKGWQGTAWRSGELVVRAGTGTQPDSRTTGLVGVVNVKTGAVVRLLATAATPLGWLDSHTVLLQADRPGIVAWDIGNGQVTSVSNPFDGTVAISPP